VRYVNDRYRRTGTLWEGRYKACLVDSESYLLRCYRYVELNPVRARTVASAADYPWSSYASNAQGVANVLIHPHPSYLSLGANETERGAAYRALVEESITTDGLDSLRLHLQRQHE
jgi:putative transposase